MRVSHKDLNKKSIEALTKSGAIDALGITRGKILYNLETIIKTITAYKKSENSSQNSLFGGITSINLNLKDCTDATRNQKMQWEKELVGLFLSDHPLKNFKHNGFGTISIKTAKAKPDGEQIKTLGLINQISKITTKAGQPMLFVKIEDLNDNIEILIFKDTIEETTKADENIWQENNLIEVRGRLSKKDNDIKLICQNAKQI